MKLGQTSVLYTAARFISSVTGFVATVFFARELGDTVLGQYALVFAVVTWFGLFSKVGLSKAITKRISEGEEENRYFGAGLLIAGTLVLVGTLAVVLLSEQVDAYVGTSATLFVVLLLAVSVVKTPLSATLNGRHLVHVNSIIQIVGGFATPAAQIGLVVVGWHLGGMVFGYLFGSILTGVLALYVLDVRPALPRKRHFRSLFDFAKYSWLGNISDKFYGTLDITVLGFFVASGLVGVYSVVWSLVTFLAIFGNGIQTTLFPELSKLSSEGRSGEVERLTRHALGFSGVILIPALIGGVLVAEDLLRIYGPSFVRGRQVLGILVLAALVRTYNKQLLNALNAIDRPDLAFRSNLVFVGVNAVLNVGLIYEFGIVGAATATALSAGIGLVLSARYTRRELDVVPPVGEVTKQWLAALLMGGVVWTAEGMLGSRTIAGLPELTAVVLVGIGAPVYFALLLGISTQFRTTVFDNLGFLPQVG